MVSALPALSLARLEIGPGGSCPLSGLGAIEHPPVASVFVGFRRDQVQHPLDGFGALVPAAEKRSILGIVFTSSLFPGLVERVCSDLRFLLGAHGRPAFVRHTEWPRAIPQYNLGYGRHLEAMAECEARHPGLLIGGNVRDGISLPDCILSGVSLAKRVS